MLSEEKIIDFKKKINQQYVDEIIQTEAYTDLEQCFVTLESEPITLSPIFFLVISHIETIRENKINDSSKLSMAKFVARCNQKVADFDGKIKTLISNCKTEKELFDLLLMLTILIKKSKKQDQYKKS